MSTLKLSDIEVPLTEENIKLMREALENQTPKSYKPWRAVIGDRYFYVHDCASYHAYEQKNGSDDYRNLTGNYFKTKDEAEKHRKRTMAIGRVTHAIIEANEGWVPDWKNDSEEEYSIFYNFCFLGFDVYTTFSDYECTVIPYCKSKDVALQIIRDHEADLRTIFGV